MIARAFMPRFRVTPGQIHHDSQGRAARPPSRRAALAVESGKTPKLHAHKLAMRVMLKALLKDLWKAWVGKGFA